jgi:hypothetical protein
MTVTKTDNLNARVAKLEAKFRAVIEELRRKDAFKKIARTLIRFQSVIMLFSPHADTRTTKGVRASSSDRDTLRKGIAKQLKVIAH